ncbi:MAG: zinc-ribbon domain-containing protein [candidate division WOR-3 bacterium]
MIVECTNCHSKYNIDQSKIPATGVKVRCPKCQNVISIMKEIPQPPPVTEPVQVKTPVQTPPVEPPQPPVIEQPAPPVVEPPPAKKVEVPVAEKISEPIPPEPVVSPPAPEPEIPEPPTAEKAVAPEPGVETVAKPVTPPPVEMSEEDKKWHERARRLAKALASDLVLYNQAKVEQGLRDGTLIQLLGAEIKRSWEYYCQQIPKHIIENSDYFKEQLNKVVGKGKEIFK